MNNAELNYRIHPGLLAASVMALVFSFRIYSPAYFQFLDSDMALHVLMAFDFSVSDSLYYWGQSRLGSLLPLLSVPLVKVGIAPIWAVSLVNYGFIIGTGFFTRIHFKNQWYWFLWFLILLFPSFAFRESIMIGHPYAPQLFIISWILFIIKKHKNNIIRQLPLLLILFGIGFWVSEMIIALIPAIGIWLLLNNPPMKLFSQVQNILKQKWKVLLPIALFFLLFIWVLKANSVDYSIYGQMLAAPKDMWFVSVKAFHFIYNGLTFQYPEMGTNLMYCFWALLFVYALVYGFRTRFSGFASNLNFILALVSLLLMLSSNWVFHNGVPERYFVLPLSMTYLTVLAHFSNRKLNIWFLVCLFIPITSFYSIYEVITENSTLYGRWAREDLKNLANSYTGTVMGNYWNGYSIAAYNPKSIIALPHQTEHCRNFRYSKDAFNADTIAIIKNGWLQDYPDTMIQYGHELYKVKERNIGMHSIGLYVFKPLDFLDIHNFYYPYTQAEAYSQEIDSIRLAPVYLGTIPSVEKSRIFLDPGIYHLQLKVNGVSENAQVTLHLKDYIADKLFYKSTLEKASEIELDLNNIEFELKEKVCVEIRFFVNQGEMTFKGAKFMRIN